MVSRTPAIKKPAARKVQAKTSVAKTPAGKKPAVKPPAGKPLATLTLSSKNYSSWSLRGWLLVKFSGLPFQEIMISPDNEDARRELLLLAPSVLVPCLTHDGAKVWNTLAIANYLDELRPNAGLMPRERIARAHCRSICGEMNSGFANLRASLPMNLKRHFPNHKVWGGAVADRLPEALWRALFVWCQAQ
jgi:glutathione S-transferase